jgi:hypothetical protein
MYNYFNCDKMTIYNLNGYLDSCIFVKSIKSISDISIISK